MEPVLQVALDFENLHRALQVAKEAVEGGADWIEVGTPLIKSEGMQAIREIKRNFPNKIVVADMKTADVGGFETELAAKSGAQIVTILGISDDPTITEAVKAGKKYGAEIMIDLLQVENVEERVKQLEKLGVKYFCEHVGIDMQMIGKDPLKILERVVSATKIPVAVAGGLNKESIPEVVKRGASVIIVGGAITKAPNVTQETEAIKRVISTGIAEHGSMYRKYSKDEILEALSKVSSSNVSDAMHREGAIHGLIPRVLPGTRIAGRALTVKTVNGDWAKPVEAIDRAKEGDILVIDADGGEDAVWGELASWSCVTKKVKGVVIWGAIRDMDDIMKIPFPAFTRYVSSNAGDPKGFGEIGSEIEINGKKIRTGDYIIADSSGVVVIPEENAQEIANRAVDVAERENRVREEIRRGSTLSSVQKLEKWEKVG
ncbi:MAG: orotidine 5'-phosphate decarboxylase [Candidatus Thermoplasmatota archaeon]|jgi:3-hexulose-6-phosphate synthase/6-phospho-3-hexuloisomerase|nr:orotidine 5'-phosphate decarboxylase [Candidatus Thermoplasmatota archaeon]MCL5789132.1 orotidine 5'-phosphate decarboxylase [Candidatus Thermoplasmatota archaeon]